jgi:hypothetical protein
MVHGTAGEGGGAGAAEKTGAAKKRKRENDVNRTSAPARKQKHVRTLFIYFLPRLFPAFFSAFLRKVSK